MTQGVAIRAEAQDRAKHHKVGDCTDAFRCEVPPAPLTEQRAHERDRGAARDHLDRRSDVWARLGAVPFARSEERRVGKEWRSWWGGVRGKKKVDHHV